MRTSELIRDIIEEHKDCLTFEQLKWLFDQYEINEITESHQSEREDNNV